MVKFERNGWGNWPFILGTWYLLLVCIRKQVPGPRISKPNSITFLQEVCFLDKYALFPTCLICNSEYLEHLFSWWAGLGHRGRLKDPFFLLFPFSPFLFWWRLDPRQLSNFSWHQNHLGSWIHHGFLGLARGFLVQKVCACCFCIWKTVHIHYLFY